MELVPHRRQFVISRSRVDLGEDWTCLELPDGFVLSHQQDLRVTRRPDGGLVLGTALPGASTADVTGLAGRFATVSWPWVGTDASALLSVYHASGPDGPLVSSSPALLGRLLPAPGAPGPDRRMWWGGMNWFPGPGSPLPQVRKLLPGQRLRLPDLTVEDSRGPMASLGPDEQARSVLADELTATVRAASEGAATTCVALTAGLDSRTVLAAVLAAGMRVETVTQVVRNPADVRVAADISRYLGVRHHVVEPSPHQEDRVRAWREHTLHAYDDADNRLLLPRDQYRFFHRGTVLLRGNAFEFGRRFLAPRFRGLDPDDLTGTALWRRFEGSAPPHAPSVAALDEWVATRRHRRDGLDLVDGFYDDHRLGGWLASLEHGLELLPGVSVVPANSARAKAALLAPTHEERTAGTVQRDVVHDLAPELERFPVNPPPTGVRRHVRTVRVRAGRATRALRQLAGGRGPGTAPR
ncbi:hypothetical protein [Aquipuribacter hungaricus]|uniref:Asparagine synthase n=1 Tax=Aquipuribacter hungaricus TaxID=545624 RepID=A0ABV7WGN2_9MICO